jgi:hypothetical protein
LIILYKGYGKYSNRLFQNLHFEAFCLEHGLAYANPSFVDIQHLYQAPPLCPPLQPARWLGLPLTNALIKLGCWGKVIAFDVDNATDPSSLLKAKNPAAKHQNTYVEGWGFRVHDLTRKYHETFRSKYALKPEFYQDNPLWQTLTAIPRQTTAVVGVHIRRGDYQTWQGGKYCFSDQVYRRVIQTLTQQIQAREQKACRFLICSNDQTSFQNDDQTLISHQPWYLDHWLMSHCDWLVGPPSTFTAWASYGGNVPVFHLQNASGEIDLADFAVCEG